jgi:hypothetical protein
MMKLIVAFCDFVNMPQNHYNILSGYDVCQYDHCDLFGLKQGDALSPLLINCASGYAIRRVQVNWDGLKLNGTHQLLEPFKYLGRTLMHQNSIPEEIKSRWKSRNACCHLVQNFCLPLCCLKIRRLRYTEL